MAKKETEQWSDEKPIPEQKPNPTPNPEKKLASLRERLKDDQKELTRQTKKQAELKEVVDNLEKTVGEIGQISVNYGQALTKLKNDNTECEDYFLTKRKMVEAAIQDKKETIDYTIQEIEKEMTGKEMDVAKLEGALSVAQKELAEAKEPAEKKRAEYELAKGYPKRLEEDLKELKGLRIKIEKEEENNNTEKMYLYIIDFEKILERTNPKSKVELEEELFRTWNDMFQANKTHREKTERVEETKKALEEAKESFEIFQVGRKQMVLEKIVQKENV